MQRKSSTSARLEQMPRVLRSLQTHHLRRLILQLPLLLLTQRSTLLSLLNLLIDVLERISRSDGRDRLVEDVRGGLGGVEPAADAEGDGTGGGEVVSVTV